MMNVTKMFIHSNVFFFKQQMRVFIYSNLNLNIIFEMFHGNNFQLHFPNTVCWMGNELETIESLLARKIKNGTQSTERQINKANSLDASSEIGNLTGRAPIIPRKSR